MQVLAQILQLPVAVTDPDLPVLLEPVLGWTLEVVADWLRVVFVFEVDLRDLLERVDVVLADVETRLQFLDGFVLVARLHLVQGLLPLRLVVQGVHSDGLVQEVEWLAVFLFAAVDDCQGVQNEYVIFVEVVHFCENSFGECQLIIIH